MIYLSIYLSIHLDVSAARPEVISPFDDGFRLFSTLDPQGAQRITWSTAAPRTAPPGGAVRSRQTDTAAGSPPLSAPPRTTWGQEHTGGYGEEKHRGWRAARGWRMGGGNR